MIMRGTRDRDGNNIRLEAVKVGRKWLTSQEAVRRFAEALTEGWGPGSETNSPRSKYERNRAADAALAELAAAGVATVESGAGR
jgi:hypothetical protein